MQADQIFKQVQLNHLGPTNQRQLPTSFGRFLNSGSRVQGLSTTASMLNGRRPIQAKPFARGSALSEVDQSANDLCVLQMVRFPTHDISGFKHIDGVSEFNPSSPPAQTMAFVMLEEGGPIYMATGESGRHPALQKTARELNPDYKETEERASVYYAGTIIPTKDGGYAWTNDSGHFTPSAEAAPQVGLPMDRFLTHEEFMQEGISKFNPMLIDNKPKFKIGPGKPILFNDNESEHDDRPLIGAKERRKCPTCNIL